MLDPVTNPLFGDGLPSGKVALESGRKHSREVQVGASAFLDHYGVDCEITYKRQAIAEGRIMQHAQIGFRDPALSREAWTAIARAVEAEGGRIDRYGICLDWSMGYPVAERAHRGKGTGLILEGAEAFRALTAAGPVAPHFGDFVIGLPAALENTAFALQAGATAIGNLGQYFTFRMPGWTEDVATTQATVEALALCAAQPVPILIHSNLDDGFAALFTDLTCAFGAVLLERYIVEDLIGGVIGHCYGHTFSDPLARLAFQRALAWDRDIPGTMVYGNTTLYREAVPAAINQAKLGSYLTIDMVAQVLLPSGHAVTPIPVTEADRIPDIGEVIDAQLHAVGLVPRAAALADLFDIAAAEAQTALLLEAGGRFKQRVLDGLQTAGVAIDDPLHLLLALRRIGARRLEELYGPGEADPAVLRGRRPVIEASPVRELRDQAEAVTACLSDTERDALSAANLCVCIASSDVHEYGKMLLAETLRRSGIRTLDAGVHAEPEALAALAAKEGASALAISTYNGVALDYLRSVKVAFEAAGLSIPIFIGGKLNQIPKDSNSALPQDVSGQLRTLGAVPCRRVEDMLRTLAKGL